MIVGATSDGSKITIVLGGSLSVRPPLAYRSWRLKAAGATIFVKPDIGEPGNVVVGG